MQNVRNSHWTVLKTVELSFREKRYTKIYSIKRIETQGARTMCACNRLLAELHS